MKKYLFIIVCVFFLVGCSTEEEDNKYAYLEYKNELEMQDDFDDEDSLDFDTYFDIKRDKEDEDIIEYSIVIDNSKVDMYDVKALLIHDYMNEEAFPSVGIFDDTVTLMANSEDSIKLSGDIYTTTNVNDINFKLYLEYIDSDNNENKIYYEVNRG